MEQNSQYVGPEYGHDNGSLLMAARNVLAKEHGVDDLKIFSHPDFGAIRCIEIDGAPWFVGKDVAAAVGYEHPTDAVRNRVGEEDRVVSKMETTSGEQTMVIINECGLYSLILSSKLPSAKKFKFWITSEVLPAIRKYGADINAAEGQQFTNREYLQAGLALSKCSKAALPAFMEMMKKSGMLCSDKDSIKLPDPACQRYQYLRQLIIRAYSKTGNPTHMSKTDIAKTIGVTRRILDDYIDGKIRKLKHKNVEEMIVRLENEMARREMMAKSA